MSDEAAVPDGLVELADAIGLVRSSWSRPSWPAGREAAWRDAVAALSPRLAALDPERHVAWEEIAAGLAAPGLTEPRYCNILAVQMHALAALLQAGDPVPGESTGNRDAREVLLDHEARYWTRLAERAPRCHEAFR